MLNFKWLNDFLKLLNLVKDFLFTVLKNINIRKIIKNFFNFSIDFHYIYIFILFLFIFVTILSMLIRLISYYIIDMMAYHSDLINKLIDLSGEYVIVIIGYVFILNIWFYTFKVFMLD